MKNSKVTGVQLYEATDTLPEKFSREAYARLAIGKSYKIIGACRVAESTMKDGTKIEAWDGFLLEEGDKQFAVGINTMTGVGFVKDGESWKAVTVSKPLFTDVKSVLAFPKTKKIKVYDKESLTVQKWNSEETVAKDFYLFEKEG